MRAARPTRDPVAVCRLRRGEAGDIAVLPGRFDGPRVVVLAHVGDRFEREHAVQYRETSQCGTGPAMSPAARDLHPFVGGAAPCLVQRVVGVVAVRG